MHLLAGMITLGARRLVCLKNKYFIKVSRYIISIARKGIELLLQISYMNNIITSVAELIFGM